MKNVMFILAISMLLSVQLTAQVNIKLIAGVAVPIQPGTNGTFINRETPKQEFIFNVDRVSNAAFLGLGIKKVISKNYFVELDLLVRRSELTYSKRNTWVTQLRDSAIDRYNHKRLEIDVPIQLGVDLGAVDVTSGFIAHILLEDDNEMIGMAGFSRDNRKIDFGWLMGAHLNISNISFGVTYQMRFSNYGSSMSVNEHSLTLLNSPSKVALSMGYSF